MLSEGFENETACYTSEMGPDQRHLLAGFFSSSRDDTKIFLSSYYVSSVGLNLQIFCNYELFGWDVWVSRLFLLPLQSNLSQTAFNE
jgi:hypothetical protein